MLRKVSSSTEITLASDEFFRALTVSLPNAGIIVRMACGAMMRRISRPGVIPSAWPASTWPRSMPSTPARSISAMKGASLAASASPAASDRAELQPDLRQGVIGKHHLQDQRRAAEDDGVAPGECSQHRETAELHRREDHTEDQPAGQTQGLSPRGVNQTPVIRYGRLR